MDIRDRKQLEVELRGAQKLESVGRLAAGIAHEINTPVQFVSDSLHFVREAVVDLCGVVRRGPAARPEEDPDIEYVLENAPKAIDRALDGLDRVATLVRSLKEFAHPDQKEMTPVDLNRAIRSTLTVARNELRYVADVETDLGELPPVVCHAGDVNQALLNIVINAAHAIADVVKGTTRRGRITIRSRHEGGEVVIAIADSGAGIPEAVRELIFDPFFTTKEAGRGTGQGLAIARNVIVEKHGGTISFETEVCKGTTFFLRLPVAPPSRGAVA
jgi:signal transduction histidine kinase